MVISLNLVPRPPMTSSQDIYNSLRREKHSFQAKKKSVHIDIYILEEVGTVFLKKRP